MSNDFKFFLGIIVGSAIGATIGYAVASGKKDKWMDALETKACAVKDDLEVFIDKINNSIRGIVERA